MHIKRKALIQADKYKHHTFFNLSLNCNLAKCTYFDLERVKNSALYPKSLGHSLVCGSVFHACGICWYAGSRKNAGEKKDVTVGDGCIINIPDSKFESKMIICTCPEPLVIGMNLWFFDSVKFVQVHRFHVHVMLSAACLPDYPINLHLH